MRNSQHLKFHKRSKSTASILRKTRSAEQKRYRGRWIGDEVYEAVDSRQRVSFVCW